MGHRVQPYQVATMIRRAESIACQVVFGEPETLLAKSKNSVLRCSIRHASSAWWTPRPPCSLVGRCPNPLNATRRRLRGLAANCFSKPPTEEKNLQRRGSRSTTPLRCHQATCSAPSSVGIFFCPCCICHSANSR